MGRREEGKRRKGKEGEWGIGESIETVAKRGRKRGRTCKRETPRRGPAGTRRPAAVCLRVCLRVCASVDAWMQTSLRA